MGLILSSYFRGFGQLSDPKTRSVVIKSIIGSILVFIGLYIALYIALKITAFVTIGWLETVFDSLAQFGVMALTWFLFPAVVTAMASLMLEDVVDAVEQRHYPEKQLAQSLSLIEGLLPALKFLGVTVGYNLLILPLLFVPPIWPFIPFIYLSLNGYLLSREYFEVVAFRRIAQQDARALRERYKVPLFIAGVGFAFLLTVPFLNLITPVVATAAMVHMFEAWRTRENVREKTGPNLNSAKHQSSELNSPLKPNRLGDDDGPDDDVIPLSGPET
jgi:uncharacterized protein involved in cysteine biosynthesis